MCLSVRCPPGGVRLDREGEVSADVLRCVELGVGSQGRAKAEGCSPSVSLTHSKGAITQD